MADVEGVEVGKAFVTVLPSTRGFHRQLGAEVNQASLAAGSSGGAAAGGAFAGSFGKALPVVGAAIAGVFSARKVVEFAQQSITAASDLAESQSKVNVVFGAASAAVNKWSEDSATSMLMSQRAALEAAGTYGNLFQAFGIGQTRAQEMSQTLVELAADLASFNNTSVDEALEALRSGLSGETEPLKRYGVALTDARLKEEALAQGIWNGVGMLDAAAKAQASYALILKDTSLAQGDVERTADGYANTMRALDAAVENAKAEIGTELLGAVQDISKALGGPDGLVALVGSVANQGANAARFFGDLASGVASVGAAISNLPTPDTSNPIWSWLTGGDGGIDLFSTADWSWLPNSVGPLATGADMALRYGEATRATSDALEVANQSMRDNYAALAAYDTAVERNRTSTDSAAEAALKYDTYLAGVANRAVQTATGVETLSEALERLNARNDVRSAGVAIRSQWRSLDTMGERVWKGEGANRRQVQLAFDPTVAGGRFGTDASGDAARAWAVQMSELYQRKASELGGAEGGAFLERAQKRLARQFREWGIDSPAAYARSFLTTRADDRATIPARDMGPTWAALGDYDESRSAGRRSAVTNFNFYGDIKADSPQSAATWAQQQARASANNRVPHGAAPVGAP